MLGSYKEERRSMIHSSANTSRPCIHADMFDFSHAHMHTSFRIFFSACFSLNLFRIGCFGNEFDNMEIH